MKKFRIFVRLISAIIIVSLLYDGLYANFAHEWAIVGIATIFCVLMLLIRVYPVQFLTVMIAFFPRDASFYGGRAISLMRRGKLGRAEDDLDRAIELNAKSAGARDIRGWLYLIRRDYARGLAEYEAAIELNPGASATYVNRAIVYMQMGEDERAIEGFKQALAVRSEDSRAHDGLALLYARKMMLQEAIEEGTLAVKYARKRRWRAMAYNARGIACARKQEYQLALKDFSRALSYRNAGLLWSSEGFVSQHKASIYANRALVQMHMQMGKEALKDVHKAIRLSPKLVQAYVTRGKIWLYQGQLERAYEDFKRAEMLEPMECLSTLVMLWINMCRGQGEEGGVERLEAAGKRCRYKRDSTLCLGVALWLREEYEEAERAMLEVIESTPGDWGGYFWHGMVSGAAERNEEALQAWRRARELRMPEVLFGAIGWFEERNGELYRQGKSEFLGG